MDRALENRKAVDDIKRRLHTHEITYDQALAEIAPILDAVNERGREIAKQHKLKPRIITAREVLR